jgi:hypothetical protein
MKGTLEAWGVGGTMTQSSVASSREDHPAADAPRLHDTLKDF